MNTKDVVCPLHKGNDHCELFWEFNHQNVHYSLFECKQCEVAFYSPFPKMDYQTHTDSISSLKDYVHLNSNIAGLILNLLSHFPDEGGSSILEVGCGFGFTLDFAKHMLGMDVVGYEPSLYGEVGARELDLNIKRTYLTKEVLKDKKTDIVYLSEVLEHVEDPTLFLDLLKNALSNKGVFILTTPNYKDIKKDINQPSELALLSPGAHTILYGPRSLEKVLSEAGFNHVHVSANNGNLLAVSSLNEVKWKSFENKNALIRDYFLNVLSRVKADSLVYTGVLYRLLRNYIDFGDVAEANNLIKRFPVPVLPTFAEINNAQTHDELNERGPACSAILAYYFGMLNLNYYSDFNSASTYFHKSALLCKKKILLAPSASVLEFDILWLANYHYALSLSYEGNYNAAIEQLKKIKHFQYDADFQLLPVPDSNLLKLTDQLMERTAELL